jgi:hypothetical protein
VHEPVEPGEIPVKVVVSLGAQIELAEAMQWWTERSLERGMAFHSAYCQIEGRIAEHPEWFPEIEPGIRRALMRRFRYSVFFVVKENQAVIVAVAHQHRRPGYWRERLP